MKEYSNVSGINFDFDIFCFAVCIELESIVLCSDLDIEEIEEINVQAHGSLQEEVEVSSVEKFFQHLEEEDVQFDSAVSCF